ncbi:ABC transporter permease [Dyadobacter psychrotolerans]|uniref:ABC transporter permease n=1 Tax=Dyadobacter psychrotolerans TaxID=2541721 RepID=A0A4R5DXB2_9BACT|nr:ABC transporter permease [Dyadobacter psychrotolerans]TDE18557.1 ABC transporter permease [Dyadobacter psychrotolerans]
MLKNYFKTTFRYLNRNRLFTSLNVIGLSVGISACWIICRIISYEFSYDIKQPHSERIFRVVSRFKSEGNESGNGGVPAPLAFSVKQQVPGIAMSVPIWENWKQSVKIPDGKTFDSPENLMSTTKEYFKMVPYQWLAGDAGHALEAPGQLVITKSRAEKYFPNISPINVLGKTILYEDSIPMQISGVVADLDYPNSFVGQEFSTLILPKEIESRWGGVNSNNMMYVTLLPNASSHKVLKQLNAFSTEKGAEGMKKYKFERWHTLIPMKEVHFSPEYNDRSHKASKKVLYGLTGIAAFLLILACINYINLTTAQVPQRAKEVGIRKTLGSSRWHLIRQFLSETLAISILALGLSYLLSLWALNSFKDLIPEGFGGYINYWQISAFLIVLVLAVTLFSGVYPGWLITRVQAASIMRSSATIQVGKNSFSLRKSLIVFQFVVAQLFIVGTLVVREQLHYLMNKDLGFDREAVVMVQVPWWKLRNNPAYKDRQFTMQQELEKQPGIEMVALGDPPMNQSFSSNTFIYKEPGGKVNERNLYRKHLDTTLLGLYKIKLLAGRNIAYSDTVREYMLNETAVKELGFKSPQDAVGKYVKEMEGTLIPVVGVVKDFHIGSFYQKIEPVILLSDKSNLTTLNIKLSSSDPAQWEAALKRTNVIWDKMYPAQPFKYEFYDSTLDEIYKDERNMSRIINLATAVAIVISCLGLFGLSTLTTYQRIKEIGIRKVLGATVTNIVALLSKDFVKLVLIAIIIASPVAWYFMDKWLQDFVYKIDIEWWMFALAGVAAIVIALLTVSFQSIRAALMNPVKTLKSE